MDRKRQLKSMIRFMIRAKRDPEAMARGLGIGVFVGFLPSVGFQFVIALLLAGVLGGNRIAAATGTLVTNPLTALPVSALSLWVGDIVLPGTRLGQISMANFNLKQLFESPIELLLSFLVGSFVLGVLGGALSYFGMRIYHSRLR